MSKIFILSYLFSTKLYSTTTVLQFTVVKFLPLKQDLIKHVTIYTVCS